MKNISFWFKVTKQKLKFYIVNEFVSHTDYSNTHNRAHHRHQVAQAEGGVTPRQQRLGRAESR